ncbi:MAG TPA: hypothetical protein VF542_16435, partial [Jatrophihabitans sp.]
NAALACRRHNLCKANTGWQYHRNHDGTLTWTDDTGHPHTNHPPQRWSNRPHTGSAATGGVPAERPAERALAGRTYLGDPPF